MQGTLHSTWLLFHFQVKGVMERWLVTSLQHQSNRLGNIRDAARGVLTSACLDWQLCQIPLKGRQHVA